MYELLPTIIAALSPLMLFIGLKGTLKKQAAEARAAEAESEKTNTEISRGEFDLMLSRIKWLEGEIERLNSIVDEQEQDIRSWAKRYAKLIEENDRLRETKESK